MVGLRSLVWQKRISAMSTEWHGRPPGISQESCAVAEKEANLHSTLSVQLK